MPKWRPIRIAAWTGLAVVGLYGAALASAGLAAGPRVSGLAVVFGNAIDGDLRPSPRLEARLETALTLYRGAIVRRVLVSGGIEQPGDRDEARAMADWLVTHGVPRAAIIEDRDGRDTMETSRRAAQEAGQDSVVAVTQWFHLPRATLMIRRFGVTEMSGAWPHFVEARDAYSFVREAIALPLYAAIPLEQAQD